MEEFKKEIQEILRGGKLDAKSKTLISPNEINDYIVSLGLEEGEMDTNGWDWDFWKKYHRGEETYSLSGSGWYNTGLYFSKD